MQKPGRDRHGRQWVRYECECGRTTVQLASAIEVYCTNRPGSHRGARRMRQLAKAVAA